VLLIRSAARALGGMLGSVDQLLEICDGRSLMLGFDRGGSYPKTFTGLRAAGSTGSPTVGRRSLPRR
jgi:hypothetical protein